jgi:hypothetical protein
MPLLDHFVTRDHIHRQYSIELKFNKETDKLTGGGLTFTLCDSDGENNFVRTIPLVDLPTVTGANKTYLQNVAKAITDDLMAQANKALFIPESEPPPP